MLHDAAATVARLARAAPALPSGTVLVCVDGPAGSGKSTLASAVLTLLAEAGRSTALVAMDDVYAGWSGLPTAGPTVATQVVAPLARGEAGAFRRYDWHRGEYAEELPVPVADVLVVEGVGAGHPGYDDLTGLLVWVSAPDDVRLARGLARDGAGLEPHWRRWLVDEARLHAEERTRERADVLVDGVTGRVRVLRGAHGQAARGRRG